MTTRKWPSDFVNKIICGDCLEVMKEMPDECIDMIICSPPYWGLRDYGIEQIFRGDKDCEHEWGNQLSHPKQEKRTIKQLRSSSGLSWNRGENASIFKWQEYSPKNQGNFCLKCQAWKGQLGLEPTPEMYIEHLTEIFNEAKRLLKKEGTLWLNMGDTYGGSGGAGGDYNIGGLREEQPKYKQPLKIMPKCLLMIPERLSWSLIQNGWILRNKIIWYKPNSMPSSVKDRFSNRWEGLFLLVKSSNPVYWTNRKTRQLVDKKPLGIKGLEGIDWEWKKLNGKLKKVSLWQSHDYYFDLDAVREPHKYDGRKDTLYKGGPKDMQIGKHERWPDPAGKNPGDVIKVERKWNEVPGQITQSIAQDHGGWYRKDGSPIVDFDKGKNPGDIIHTPAETRTLGAILGVKGAIKVPGGKGWVGHPKGGGAACQKDPRWCSPEGKNPGDFLEINTQPFPEAHFAVFPEKLCEKPIKAGCPEQVCKRCGKARERIIDREKAPPEVFTKKNTPPEAYTGSYVNGKMRGQGQKLQNWREQHPPKTIGLTSCDCNAGFEGGIVLDPFAGAGTVGVVAKKLGRRFILIDIKKEYCDMAKKRIVQVGYQMELRI